MAIGEALCRINPGFILPRRPWPASSATMSCGSTASPPSRRR